MTTFAAVEVVEVLAEALVVVELLDACVDEVAVGWLSFTRIVGLEKVNPAADKRRNPPTSRIDVVATLDVPSTATTETVAEIAPSVNP